MQIRDARPADVDAIAAVARATWHAAYDDLLGPDTVEETVDSWYDPEPLREELRETAGSEACFLVAEDDDVVGFATAGPARDRESDPAGRDAFFARLYVEPDRWGEGIGTELTAEVAERLRDAGHEAVWLEVFDGNERGRSFYESLGFERIGSASETFGGREVTTLHLSAPVSELVEATPARE